jgi:hypothetical protein
MPGEGGGVGVAIAGRTTINWLQDLIRNITHVKNKEQWANNLLLRSIQGHLW